MDQAPTKRKRCSSRMYLTPSAAPEKILFWCLASIDPTLFHDLLWGQARYR